MRELLLCKAVPPQWGAAYAALLAEGGLRDEGHTDITALLTEDGALLGCGSLGGKVIRQVAVSTDAEGQDACARLRGVPRQPLHERASAPDRHGSGTVRPCAGVRGGGGGRSLSGC